MQIVLVIAYLSMYGLPTIEVHPRDDMNTCRKEATAYFKQVKVGSARAWCDKVILERKK